MRVLKHLKTVCKHKYYVFKFCIKAGIVWQGIVHDLSKFSPTEFIESVKYYDGKVSPIVRCKEVNGVSYAWLHHKGRNKHHYEYWQDNFDLGGQPLRIPFKYALEQICDYLGAGKAYMGKDFSYQKEYEWWINRTKNPIAMHIQTKEFTNLMLKTLAESNSSYCLKKQEAYKIYCQAAEITKTTLSLDVSK